jgi:hypothetical protein
VLKTWLIKVCRHPQALPNALFTRLPFLVPVIVVFTKYDYLLSKFDYEYNEEEKLPEGQTENEVISRRANAEFFDLCVGSLKSTVQREQLLEPTYVRVCASRSGTSYSEISWLTIVTQRNLNTNIQ